MMRDVAAFLSIWVCDINSVSSWDNKPSCFKDGGGIRCHEMWNYTKNVDQISHINRPFFPTLYTTLSYWLNAIRAYITTPVLMCTGWLFTLSPTLFPFLLNFFLSIGGFIFLISPHHLLYCTEQRKKKQQEEASVCIWKYMFITAHLGLTMHMLLRIKIDRSPMTFPVFVL